MMVTIVAMYFVVGLLISIWTAGAFTDPAQWLSVAGLVVIFWPLFVVGILLTYAVTEIQRRR
jgi:hypothetical protein